MARVAIVGCGAMGSVYAALMANAGHEVFGITLWPDHAAAMRENGLRVEGASGDRTVRIEAGTSTDGIGHERRIDRAHRPAADDRHPRQCRLPMAVSRFRGR